MLIANIYGEDIELLGVKIRKDDARQLKDFGDTTFIKENIDTFIKAIDAEAIELRYSDGVAVVDIDTIVEILMGIENSNIGRYYYLRDTFEVKKDEPVLKKFIGKVYRIAITPRKEPIEMSAKCESGLEFPEDGLPACETFELKPEFGSDINEVYLATDKASVWVTVIMDGYSTEALTVLQPFINDWKE